MGERKTYLMSALLAAFAVGIVLTLAVVVGVRGTVQTGDAPTSPGATAPADEAAQPDAEGQDVAVAFPSWNAESPALASLTAFVQDVCDEGSPNYVEPADRVATFDMDGTILCEKAPIYVDYMLLMHRVLEDPDYKAPADITKLCKQLRENADRGIVDPDLDLAKNDAFSRVFAGMTQEEFHACVSDFVDTQAVEGFDGMTYGSSFYRPMREVIDYLRANDFDVYIVTACEREVARALAASHLGIAADHVMGTDTPFVPTGQGDTPINDYTLTQDDDLVLSDAQAHPLCAKGGKVVYIQREIGKVPILAFGNSSGDFAMLNYAQGNDAHAGMGVLVVADDTEREYGNAEKAASMYDEASAEGWLAVSMRDDWATIYGEDVERTALVADTELAKAA